MWVGLMLACGTTEPEPEPVEPTPTPYVRPPPIRIPKAIPGEEILRVDPAVVDAGRAFRASRPFRFEFHVPAGITISTHGLPAYGEDELFPDPLDDGSILQLEIPAHRNGEPDEAPDITDFAPAKFCVRKQPCSWGEDDDGRWRVFRMRQVGEEPLQVREMHAGHPRWDDRYEGGLEVTKRIIAVWLPEDGIPLDEHDTILFTYVGPMPRRSTTWFDPPQPLRAHFRYRADGLKPSGRKMLAPPVDNPPGGMPMSSLPLPPPISTSDCPSFDPGCWVTLPAEQVQGLEVNPGPPAFVRTIAPLDVTVGEPTSVRFVVLDAQSNPSPMTGTLQPRANGRSLGEALALEDDWEVEATFTPRTVGPVAVKANTSFSAHPVYHYTMVHAAAEVDYPERLTGDLHAHSGGSGLYHFQPSALAGDHRGDFTRAYDTLAYMHRVAGLEFGALAEHAVGFDGFKLPDGEFSVFEKGGLCEVKGRMFADGADWWTESQAIMEAFDRDHPAFTGFPGYEWHGTYERGELDSRLHRVVTFLDYKQGGWPMLPGSTHNRPPQCLFHFLEQASLTPADVVVMPHMMYAKPHNQDWDLTYRPKPPWDALVSADAPDKWQRVGEMFSARNYAVSRGGQVRLSRMEGVEEDPRVEPWTFRYGWRDTAATLGIIGGSDDHTQMAGSDNLFAADGSSDHSHNPGGIAVVLSSGTDRRRGIFNALHDRVTYGTSGPRAWLDYYVEHGGTKHPMGRELSGVSSCSVKGRSVLLVGRSIRDFALWTAPVGGDAPFTAVVAMDGGDKERGQLDFDLVNPLIAQPNAPRRWLYYVRAFVGTPGTAEQSVGHQDAVWSSPIWIDWLPPSSACE